MISKIFLTIVCIVIAITFIAIFLSTFIRKDDKGNKLVTDWNKVASLIVGCAGLFAMALTLYLINN